MSHIIECQNIHHKYGNLDVLCGVDLNVESGEVLSIVGRSGAGKSTLLQIMGTLLAPTSGKLLIGGEEVTKFNDKHLSAFRANNIGFVFQEHHLLPEFSALENVQLAGVIAGADKRMIEKRSKELLEMLGLGDRLKHKPSALSGGEQQRVAVARALLNNPMVVFADEPTGNLDSVTRAELNSLFLSLRDTMGQTFVIVTHENDLADMCDRKIVMQDGNII